MTMQRQYSLPNCTLILEGFGDDTAAGIPSDGRPLMSKLGNAECYFAGREQPISGGLEFFQSFVRAVSEYAQEFLSGVRRTGLSVDAPGVPDNVGHSAGTEKGHLPWVRLQKIDGNLHRLIVQRGDSKSTASQPPIQIDLTAVQLFDLVEAVDQFFEDTRTLPQLERKLTPVSKKEARIHEPVAKRSLPAALGVSSLALTAVAFFLVPIPEVQRPRDPLPQPNSSQSKSMETSTGNGGGDPPPTPNPSPPSASELETALQRVPEITDPSQLEVLKKQLYTQIDKEWNKKPSFDRDLVYRVGVGKDGAIVGYKPENKEALDYAKETPLLDLVYRPAAEGTASPEAIAIYKVVFKPSGVLQVSPWRGYANEPSPPPDLSDDALLEDLQQKLYSKIDKNWKQKPSFERELIYRIGITQEGAIADYEALNQPARDYLKETPLTSLHEPESAVGRNTEGAVAPEPLAQFRVVFTPKGVLQVSPWKGYQ